MPRTSLKGKLIEVLAKIEKNSKVCRHQTYPVDVIRLMPHLTTHPLPATALTLESIFRATQLGEGGGVEARSGKGSMYPTPEDEPTAAGTQTRLLGAIQILLTFRASLVVIQWKPERGTAESNGWHLAPEMTVKQ